MANPNCKTRKKSQRRFTETIRKLRILWSAATLKIEDAFVDRYLTKEGESVAEAKARLKHAQDTQR